MLNEEITKDLTDTGSREINDKILKPFLNFVSEHLVKPTEKMLVNDLKLALKVPFEAMNPEHGEMTVKQLIRKDQGAQAIDIDGAGLKDFRRIANKFGVDFAIIESTKQNPPKFTVFFKARDADAIQAVVNSYTANQLNISKHKKPSILQKLKKFKELVASMAKRVIEKKKEYER